MNNFPNPFGKGVYWFQLMGGFPYIIQPFWEQNWTKVSWVFVFAPFYKQQWTNMYICSVFVFHVYFHLHHPTILWAALNKNVNFLRHFVFPSFDMWSTQTFKTFSTSKLFVGAIQSEQIVGKYKILDNAQRQKIFLTKMLTFDNALIKHAKDKCLYIKDLVQKEFSLEIVNVSKCAIDLANFQF